MSVTPLTLRAIALALVAGACNAAPRGDAGGGATPSLDDLWTVEFKVESPLQPGHMPRQTSVKGRVALLENGSPPPVAELPGRPSYSGTYSVDFRPFRL